MRLGGLLDVLDVRDCTHGEQQNGRLWRTLGFGSVPGENRVRSGGRGVCGRDVPLTQHARGYAGARANDSCECQRQRGG